MWATLTLFLDTETEGDFCHPHDFPLQQGGYLLQPQMKRQYSTDVAERKDAYPDSRLGVLDSRSHVEPPLDFCSLHLQLLSTNSRPTRIPYQHRVLNTPQRLESHCGILNDPRMVCSTWL